MENLGTFGSLKYLVSSFLKNIERFFKYQIVTKLIFMIIFTPLFWAITEILINLRGKSALINSGIIRFVLTPEGLFLLIFLLFFIGVNVLIELFGTIVISARILKGKSESSYFSLIKYNLKISSKLFNVGIIFIIFYLLILIPLTGAGPSISFLNRIKIPNFVIDFIFNEPKYLIMYALAIIAMLIISVLSIFTFHFIVIGEFRAIDAVAASIKLVRENFIEFLKKFFLISLLISIIAFVLLIIWLIIIAFLVSSVNMKSELSRILLMFLYFIQELGIRAATLFFIPFEVYHITTVFYGLVARTKEFSHLRDAYPNVVEKSKKSMLDKVLARRKTIILFLFLGILLISVPMGLYFNENFRIERNTIIVGHRGGGGIHIPENSISAIKKGIEDKAKYVEIDVQRTKDNKYIVNHDNNFQRMANDNRTSFEMSLDEIKTLDIGYKFPGYEGEKIADIEEVLDVTKDKAGIFLEFKGATVDKKMVDDLYKIVKEKNMISDVIFMSLNYDVMDYMENTYPDAFTGFIAYVTIGDVGSINTDIIVLEESMVTNGNLTNLYFAGKYPVVWTVNDMSALEKYIEMDIYGVITDDVKDSIDTISKINSESDNDYMLKMFLNLK